MSTKTLAFRRGNGDETRIVIDIFLHLDAHLNTWITALGPWFYVLLFLIIFCETGLVVMPFLPGDSLLFAVGAVAAVEQSTLHISIVVIVLIGAAILGDSTNYFIGRRLGPKVFRNNRRWLNHNHLVQTQAFYDRHGGKTVILARFLPIIRTFAPFVAGVGKMPYARFAMFSVTGSLVWVGVCTMSGYYFGNIPAIKSHFEAVVVGIILISMLPLLIRLAGGKLKKSK